MAESSSMKRQSPFSSATLTQEKKQKGDNFDDDDDDVFGCYRLSFEKRKMFFGEEISEEDMKKEEEEKERKMKLMSQIPTTPIPVYNLCVKPVSEDVQKRKGLHTVKTDIPPPCHDFKPIFSAFEDGNLFSTKGESLFAARALRPLTPAEETRLNNLFGPLPAPAPSSTRLFGQPPRPERCTTGEILSPYCKCSPEELASHCCHRYRGINTLSSLPHGALEEHRPHFVPIWLAYELQTRQSHYFDIDDLPGNFDTGVRPLQPSVDFNSEDGLPLELANLAIKEYNEKESNVFKYKVLKIEKANLSMFGCTIKYWMTVKVLNLTLVTPIDTFQIHAGLQIGTDEKTIFCSRLKEEVNVGFPCCHVCFGKLDR